MISKGYATASAALVVLMIAAGVAAIANTPQGAQIAIHFGAHGNADDWARPTVAFLLVPGLAAALWVVLALSPRIDPRRANLLRSQAAFGIIWLTATLILALTQAGLIAVAAGWNVPMPNLVTLGGALLLILSGNVMGKLRPNNFVGIRTPWTRADDRVWDKTHRLAGFTFVAGGLAVLLLAVLVHNPALLIDLTVAVLSVTILLPVAWSYVFWRRVADGGSPA